MRIPRKMEHVHHALRIGQSGETGFADLHLVPNALPETALNSIKLETRIGELNLSSPIIINAMTGGAPETEEINRELAIAARETGVAMAVGSQMSAIRNKDMRSSYQICRKVNPEGILIGNLGSEATVAQALEAVEMLEANALQIHLNVMQELIMPEGDRDFRGMLERITAIAAALPVPLIIKEVGFGIPLESAKLLKAAGVRILDVGGSGGTNFAAIENARREKSLDWLNDWGCPTSITLLECISSFEGGSIIASGGIRSSMEIVKAMAAGASAVGMAGYFLRIYKEQGTEALVSNIHDLHEELKLIMTALGTPDVTMLNLTPLVITGRTREWCEQRGINPALWARRGNPSDSV